MMNPRLSSHLLARPIMRMTSPGSLPSKSGSEKGACLPPPKLGAFIACLSTLLVDAGVTCGESDSAFSQPEISLRQLSSAGLACFCCHLLLLRLLLISLFVLAENLFWIHGGKQTA